MIRENSAGGIVFRKHSSEQSEEALSAHQAKRTRKDKIFILMIRDHNNKYTFPKGLIEKGESSKQSALREVEEETGVKAEIIEKLDDLKFFFVRNKEKVFKTVALYLMETSQIELTPQFEVKSAEWIPLEESEKKCIEEGYKNQEAIIKMALEKIKDLLAKKSLKDF